MIRESLLRMLLIRVEFMNGAPIVWNGLSVPLPSLMFVCSKIHVPGYTKAVSNVLMFGEGGTHRDAFGNPDCLV